MGWALGSDLGDAEESSTPKSFDIQKDDWHNSDLKCLINFLK